MGGIITSSLAGFNPLTAFTTNCSFWLDADDLTTMTLSGSSVTQWRDKARNLSFTIGTGSVDGNRSPPVLSSKNGRGAVQFNGTNTILRNASGDLTPLNRTIFVVVEKGSGYDANGEAAVSFCPKDSTAYGYFTTFGFVTGYPYNSKRVDLAGAASRWYEYTFNTGDLVLMRSQYRDDTFLNSTYIDYQLYVNKTISTRTTNIISGFMTSFYKGIVLGGTDGRLASGYYGNYFSGKICEIICFDNILSNSESEIVENYLSNKWGIGLSGSENPVDSPLSVLNNNYILDSYSVDIDQSNVNINSPLSINGCQLWLDGSDPTTISLSGSYVTQWGDKSGYNRHMTEQTSPPTYSSGILNNKNVINFDVNARMSIPNSSGLFSFMHNSIGGTVIYVVKPFATDTNSQYGRFLHSDNNSSANIGFNIFFDDRPATLGTDNSVRCGVTRGISGTSTSSFLVNNTIPQSNKFFLNSIQFNNVVSTVPRNRIQLFFNGRQSTGSNTDTNAASTSSTSSINLTLGSPNGDSFNGQLAELIIYSGILTDTDLSLVEKYLAKKWASEIPSSCKMWIDCSDISTLKQISDGTTSVVTTGNPIGYIADKSGNGNHLIQPALSNRPVLDSTTFNGLPAASFEAPQYMYTDSLSVMNGNDKPVTVFMVCKPKRFVINGSIFAFTKPDSNIPYLTLWGQILNSVGTAGYVDIRTRADDLTNKSATSAYTSQLTTEPVLFTVKTDGLKVHARQNGLIVLNNVDIDVNNKTLNRFSINVNANSAMAYHQNITLGELLIFDSALSDSQIATIEKYLSKKWGLGIVRPDSSHKEVKNFINRVYANGGSISQDTIDKVTDFCYDIDNAGLRSKLWRLNLFCGNNVNAATVPLYRGPDPLGQFYGNPVDVNNGPFVGTDYNERGPNGGLKNNRVNSKYLNTGFRCDTIPYTDTHMSIYVTPPNSGVLINSPTNISGCSLWLDAADSSVILLNSSAVSGWNDKSGNGRHFIQTSGVCQPTYVASGINSKNIVRFDGSNDLMIGSSGCKTLFQNLGEYTIFSVYKPSNLTSQNRTILADTYGLGSELWSVVTPTIQNTAGSNGVWNSGTLTMSNTAIGTNAGYPRFDFGLSSMVSGRIYTVSGLLTGDISSMQAGSPIRLSTGGAYNYITYDANTGAFFGTVTASTNVGIEFILDGTKLSNVTISNVSIKETSLRNRLYTSINSTMNFAGKRTTIDNLNALSTINTMSTNTTYITAVQAYPSGQRASLYFSGEFDTTSSLYTGAGNTDNTPSYEVVLGSIGSLYAGGGCEMLQGDLAELVVYNRKLDNTEMASVTKYLANKWGILSVGIMSNPAMGSFMGGTPDPSLWYGNQYRISFDNASINNSTLVTSLLAGNSQANDVTRSVDNGGHIIVSRSGTNDLRLYDDGTQLAFNSTAPTSGYYQTNIPIFIFGFSTNSLTLQGGSQGSFNGYVGGYSIGNNLSPTEASIFSRIMNKFQRSLNRNNPIPYTSNSDVAQWLERVYQNGGIVSQATADAVTTFANTINVNGLRNKFYRLNLFCGSNLNACVVPLYSNPGDNILRANYIDLNSNYGGTKFSPSNYSEVSGLDRKSTGTTTNGAYLDTGFNAQLIGSQNMHGSVVVLEENPTQGAYFGGTTQGGLFVEAYYDPVTSGSNGYLNTSFVHSAAAPSGNVVSMLTWVRYSNTNLTAYRNATAGTPNTTSITASDISSGIISIFARTIWGGNGVTLFHNGRLGGYSFGLPLTSGEMATYYNAMKTLQSSIGRSI